MWRAQKKKRGEAPLPYVHSMRQKRKAVYLIKTPIGTFASAGEKKKRAEKKKRGDYYSYYTVLLFGSATTRSNRAAALGGVGTQTAEGGSCFGNYNTREVRCMKNHRHIYTSARAQHVDEIIYTCTALLHTLFYLIVIHRPRVLKKEDCDKFTGDNKRLRDKIILFLSLSSDQMGQ